MRTQKLKATFQNEAALCAAFIAALPEGWTAYPETGGFDIVLVRGVDGAQVGIEAKLTLNAKVLLQAVEGMYSRWETERAAPDFRAVLVPSGTAGAELSAVARHLGIVVIECRENTDIEASIERRFAEFCGDSELDEKRAATYRKWAENDVRQNWRPFSPSLPDLKAWRDDWVDHCPPKRIKLPDYVPDVAAGSSAPSTLSEWKVKAIKICIILEKRGTVSMADFKHIGIDRKRWLDMRWLRLTDQRGVYVAGLRPLDLRRNHPVNYVQIEADWEKWAPKEDLEVTT